LSRVSRRLLAPVAIVLILLVFGGTGLSAPFAWRTVASAHRSSNDYVSVSITKKVVSGRAARIYVRASATVSVHGEAMCVGSTFKGRNFTRTLRTGYRSIPLPLTRAECTYLLGIRMNHGGSIRLRLEILF